MRNSELLDENARPNSALATAETWIGAFLLATLLLHHVLSLFGVGLALEGMLGLLPLMLLYISAGFLIAGGMLRRFPDNPIFCNIPVLLSLAILVLALL